MKDPALLCLVVAVCSLVVSSWVVWSALTQLDPGLRGIGIPRDERDPVTSFLQRNQTLWDRTFARDDHKSKLLLPEVAIKYHFRWLDRGKSRENALENYFMHHFMGEDKYHKRYTHAPVAILPFFHDFEARFQTCLHQVGLMHNQAVAPEMTYDTRYEWDTLNEGIFQFKHKYKIHYGEAALGAVQTGAGRGDSEGNSGRSRSSINSRSSRSSTSAHVENRLSINIDDNSENLHQHRRINENNDPTGKPVNSASTGLNGARSRGFHEEGELRVKNSHKVRRASNVLGGHALIMQEPLKFAIAEYGRCLLEIRSSSPSNTPHCRPLYGRGLPPIEEWIVRRGSVLFRSLIFNSRICDMKGGVTPAAGRVQNYRAFRGLGNSHKTLRPGTPRSGLCQETQGNYVESLEPELVRQLLDFILENLQNWFAVVGLYEDLFTSLKLFHQVFRLPLHECNFALEKSLNSKLSNKELQTILSRHEMLKRSKFAFHQDTHNVKRSSLPLTSKSGSNQPLVDFVSQMDKSPPMLGVEGGSFNTNISSLRENKDHRQILSSSNIGTYRNEDKFQNFPFMSRNKTDSGVNGTSRVMLNGALPHTNSLRFEHMDVDINKFNLKDKWKRDSYYYDEDYDEEAAIIGCEDTEGAAASPACFSDTRVKTDYMLGVEPRQLLLNDASDRLWSRLTRNKRVTQALWLDQQIYTAVKILYRRQTHHALQKR